MNETLRYGLIEAGGTKFVLGIAERNSPSAKGYGTITARHRIPTTTPGEVLPAAIAWFQKQGLQPAVIGPTPAAAINPTPAAAIHSTPAAAINPTPAAAIHSTPAAAIGIASFGPLDLDRASPGWGHITRTPKPHWNGADLVGPFAEAFGCPVGLETDVNGAALAESRWGAGVGHNSLLYLTVGTGIGGGFVSRDHLLAGLTHPEMGHIRVPRHPLDGGFAGVCRFHGDCLEGLASGPAIIARWGSSLSEMAPAGAAADMIGWYLGQAIGNFQAILQPARIVLGGGVMATSGLLDTVRRHAHEAGGGYFAGDPTEVVVAPGLDNDSGLLGALAVALAST